MNDVDKLIEGNAVDQENPKLRLWKTEIAAARMSFSQSNFKDAERLVNKALALSKSLAESKLAEGVCHLELGLICACTQRKQEAFKELEKTINIGIRLGNNGGRLICGLARIHQSRLYFDQDDLGQSIESIKSAIEILEKTGTEGVQHLATALCDLGGIFLVQGKYVEARPILRSARDVISAISGPDSPAYLKAAMLDDMAQTSPNDEAFFEIWITAVFRAQYQMGAKHPLLLSALRRLYRFAIRTGHDEVVGAMVEAFPEFKPDVKC